MPSAISICTGQAITFDMPPILQMLLFAYYLVWTGLGLHSDVSLYRLLKSRQAQRQESKLVLWKSNNPRSEDQEIRIPLRATLVGTAAFLTLLIFFAIAFKVLAEDIRSFGSGMVIIAGSLWGIFMLPSTHDANFHC